MTKKYDNKYVLGYIKAQKELDFCANLEDLTNYFAFESMRKVYEYRPNIDVLRTFYYYKPGFKFCEKENINQILENSRQTLLYYEQAIKIIELLFNCTEEEAEVYFDEFTNNPNDDLKNVLYEKTKEWGFGCSRLLWKWLAREKSEFPKYDDCLKKAKLEYEKTEKFLKFKVAMTEINERTGDKMSIGDKYLIRENYSDLGKEVFDRLKAIWDERDFLVCTMNDLRTEEAKQKMLDFLVSTGTTNSDDVIPYSIKIRRGLV